MQSFVKDNTINGVKVFLELVVYLESLWELMSQFVGARLNERDHSVEEAKVAS